MGAMTREVKGRPYDTTGRREASSMTRQRIIDGARSLMLTRGYRAATVAEIARQAGVNTDTVYELVGRKAEIVRELIEQAISGTDHAVQAEERAHVIAIHAEPDPARKLAIYARATRATQERLAPLFLVLREAAATETAAADVWNEIAERRATNMRKLAAEIQAAGGLRDGLTVDEAADVIWATNGPELYVLLTGDRGWPPERFERWLAETWRRLLLP